MEYNNLPHEDIKLGELYEIDHAHLPPTAPAHLRRIRAARVWKKTEMDVEVRFPSMENLNTYVHGQSVLPHPALHDKFVMGLALATKVLVREVPDMRLIEHQHKTEFWLISAMEAEKRKEEVKIKDNEINENLKRKRKTKKPKDDLIRKEQRTCSSSLVKEKTAQVETEETEITRREEVLQALNVKDGSFQTITWSKLSAEVRKKIADTGLLDHIPDFRSRHNPDGTVENVELVDIIRRRDADASTLAWITPKFCFKESTPDIKKSSDRFPN